MKSLRIKKFIRNLIFGIILVCISNLNTNIIIDCLILGVLLTPFLTKSYFRSSNILPYILFDTILILSSIIFKINTDTLTLRNVTSKLLTELFMFTFYIIILFLSFIRLCYNTSKDIYRSERLIQSVFIAIILRFLFFIQAIKYKIIRFLPIISYIYMTIFIIIGFALIYFIQDLSFLHLKLPDGYFSYNFILLKDSRMIDKHIITSLVNYVYFSSTTFFTVGYGDVSIYGLVPKITVQIEMFISNILLVIFLPISLQFLMRGKIIQTENKIQH